MTSNPKTIQSIPCKVDALSLTWSPTELLRIKHLAKIGACLKGDIIETAKSDSRQRHLNDAKSKMHKEFLGLNAFDNTGYQNVISRYKDACSTITKEYEDRRFKDLSLNSMHLVNNEIAARYELRDMLKGDLEVDTAVKYDDRLNNLLDNIGVDLVDTLCCGEAERFVCRLNNVFTSETYMWTVKNNPMGRFNYQYSATLYADGVNAGIIAWGGKNLGCYVSFMGTGCDALDMARLYQEIKNIPEIKITRIDLAHDDYAGTRSINVARKLAKKGGFNCGGRPSSYMYIESGHLNQKIRKDLKKEFRFIPDKGRSLYVGSRESGKLLRVYEKGIQMGDPKDKWVRWELELHSSQRIIPLDTMIKPSEYLAGAYPALSFLNEEQSVIKTIVKKMTMTVDRIIENQVISTRKAINMMRVLCDMSDSEIIDKFLKGLVDPFSRASLPQRLNITTTEEEYLKQCEQDFSQQLSTT
ncbi:MAG: replication protein [Colwellia sp.]|nr:MAG: replication protein [Colwellia sp.]